MKDVVMLKDDRAAPDGHTVVEYAEGEIYSVPDHTAEYFEKNKSARAATDKDKAAAAKKAKGAKDKDEPAE